MPKQLQINLKPVLRFFVALSLILALALSHADSALAARSGGRIGGGSFRMPSSSRTYAPPSSGGYNYYPSGGGFGLPFLLPFWGFGGGFGGLFTLLIFFAIANSLVQAFRRGNDNETEFSQDLNPNVSVTRIQVGLLAQARDLQTELNHIAEAADTNTPQGRAEILQEASLALLRHPEYWVYVAANSQQARLESAEAQFNRLSLAERSKFSEETLSNVNNHLRSADPQAALTPDASEIDHPISLISEGHGRYIIVTLLAATLGKWEVPSVNNADDLRQALRQMGSIPGEQLLAIEVLWTPQAENETLTSDDLFAEYPDLKLV
jgi:uncharacterized membrane protein